VSAQPRISVIIPTYNRRHVLPRSIESVLAQNEPDFELIVVDDASSDDTQSYLSNLADSRIRVISSERNLGSSGARNLGIEAARADIVAFLDSDDAYLPNRLSAPLAVFAAAPDVVCTLSSAVKVGRKPSYVARVPDLDLPPEAFEWALICYLLGVEGTGITARRGPSLAVGGFRLALTQNEDRDFVIRLTRHGAGRLIAEPLWEKWWSDDGLSQQWRQTGCELLVYFGARPEYLTRFRKVAAYLATRVLVSDLRRGLFATFGRDIRGFRAAGLIDGDLVRMLRDYREVHRYRRAASKPEALAALTGPPESWA